MRGLSEEMRAAAEGFGPSSIEQKSQLLAMVAQAQQVISGLPDSVATFAASARDSSEFLAWLAVAVGEGRFEVLLDEVGLDDESLRSFRQTASEAGGIVSLLPNRLELAGTHSTAGIVSCVSGVVLVLGGGWLAYSGAAAEDIPLAALGIGLLGIGGYTMAKTGCT